MAEPLIRSRHLVGGWDPDARAWTARDFTPGPAGSAGLELPGGVEVEVDVAAPATLVGLWVPSDDREDTLRTTVALLGAARTKALRARRDDGPPRVLRVGGPDDPYDEPSQDFGTVRGRAGVAPALARLALALDVSDDPARASFSRALALLDAAVATDDLSDDLPLGDRARDLATEAVELLLSAARDGTLADGPVDAYALAAALEQAARLLGPSLGGEARSLAADLARRGSVDDRVASMPVEYEDSYDEQGDEDVLLNVAALRAPPAVAADRPTPRAAAVVLDVVDRAALPVPFARARVVARATTESEIEVRIHDEASRAEGWWARAFDSRDVLVAAAPLRAAGSDAVARLLVPPALLTRVTVDITDAPGQPRPSARLRSVVDAVQAGRAASRAERLEQRFVAEQRWATTSQAWEEAGDPARAGLAGEYARGTRGRRGREEERVPAPLLSDPAVDAEG